MASEKACSGRAAKLIAEAVLAGPCDPDDEDARHMIALVNYVSELEAVADAARDASRAAPHLTGLANALRALDVVKP
jgi:hypothetical protein